MSIRVRVPESVAREVHFAYSPVLEAILSLSVLAQPGHHPLHHEWVRETRRVLPPEMKQTLADFRFGHMDYIPAGLVPDAENCFPGFDQEMERIRALPLEEQSMPILRNLLGSSVSAEEWSRLDDAGTRQMILERAMDLGSVTVELVRLGFHRPRELAHNLLAGVERYWQVAFAGDWERTEPKLAATVSQAKSGPAAGGLFAMLATLRPRIGIDAASRQFWVRREHEEEIALEEGARVMLIPSGFIWPHIGLVQRPPDWVALIYPAPFASFDSPVGASEDGFVPLLRALGDGTRLRALKLIAERPRSSQELAQLIAISEPAMSRHLRQLAQCGVLETRRDGYYRLYSLERGRLESLSAMLLEFLESD